MCTREEADRIILRGLFPLTYFVTTNINNLSRWVKDQQMNHSFIVLVLNILLLVSAFQNAIIRESDMNMLRLCPMSWEAEKDGSCVL
jgi:hypothetical protein